MNINKNKIKELVYGKISTEELKSIAFDKKKDIYSNILTFSPKVFIPLTTLCQDHCSYCTFVKTPSEGGTYLTESEVLAIAQAGESANCSEALFTLGDKPELKWNDAKEFLSLNQCDSTDEYLLNMMKSVIYETTLFPHANPGLMNEGEILNYRKYSVSGGLMVETFSSRLLTVGHPHYKCSTKSPDLRIKSIKAANNVKYPMTTGLLVGIGQNDNEVVEDLWGMYNLTTKFECIQEVIIQNFVPKVNTLMAHSPEPAFDFFCRLLAVTRIILPRKVAIQAPPNLTEDYSKLLDSGINDLGGISPLTIDWVNPDKLWPDLSTLSMIVEESNQKLMSRLPVYPDFIDQDWLSPEMYERVISIVDKNGYTEFTTMESI